MTLLPDSVPGAPWAQATEDVLAALHADRSRGLSTGEAATRRSVFGPNALREPPQKSSWLILIAQFRGLLVLLLALAAGISLVVGDFVEAAAVLAVLLINGVVGFLTEHRAVRSMEALRRLGEAQVTVLRDGAQQPIAAAALVPGDIVLLEAGDLVGADARLVEATRLQADESALTGESMPIAKDARAVAANAFIGDRFGMVHKGTSVTAGAGVAVVTATGERSEVGKIATLVEQAQEKEETPLERKLNRLGQSLVWVTLVIAALVAATGILSGKPVVLILETAIALAVASVPEGLPILATMILARGVRRMAQRKALVKRLSAVETLGSVGIICTDKTGTLTENRMSVDRIAGCDGDLDDRDVKRALELAALCNHAALGSNGDNHSGDPLEIALLEAASKASISVRDLREQFPQVKEVPFDSQTKRMATFHQEGDHCRIAIKGAPEAVISSSNGHCDRQVWLDKASKMAREGLRVIAVGTGTSPSCDGDPYRDLEVVALIGLLDPPRVDVAGSIAACRAAGIDIVMMTGDHPETARHIAARVGIVDDEDSEVFEGRALEELDMSDPEVTRQLLDARIFARVTPKQKLDLIELHQSNGRIVAMTGDGVNDAPALRKAQIGVAMGMRGTEVARQASDVVLLDDAFTTIVMAVREGRGIFANIRSFVVYLLSCNLSEILVVGLATAVRAPLPLMPLQILFLNLVTDVFPALALGANETSPTVMQESPRQLGERILGFVEWRRIIGYGVVITAATLAAFFLALYHLDLPASQAVTVAFLTLALAQLWHVFNMGSIGLGLFRSEVARNKFVWGAVALCLVLLALAVYAPPVAQVLSLEAVSGKPLLLAVGASFVPLFVGGLVRTVSLVRTRQWSQSRSTKTTAPSHQIGPRVLDHEET